MVLQSCQEQISDLLSSGSSWVNPSGSHIKAAKYLSNLGLIRIQEKHYIICAHKEDRLDWPNVVDPNCDNEIFIDENFDEVCDNIICENCNRDIFPNSDQKQRFHLLSVYLNPEKIIDWFESQLSNPNFMWQKVEKGIYYVGGWGNIVNIIILDFCTDETFLTIDKLRIHPTILIVLKRNIPDIPLDLFIVQMVDLFCQRKALIEVFQEAIKRGIPKLIPNTSMQVLPASYISLKRIEHAKERKLLELRLVEGTLHVNDIEVVSEKAVACINIVQTLFGQFLDDCKKGLPPEKYTLLSIKEIGKRLDLSQEADLEQKIRRPLNKMQERIKSILARKLGLNIERDDVIQTVGWPGSSSKGNGYRINPFTLVIKMFAQKEG